METAIYRKHNSFVGIRQKQTPAGQLARIRILHERLTSGAAADGRRAVVLQACAELLGLTEVAKGQAPFRLHDNVVAEIARIEDADLSRYLFYRYRYEIYPERKILDDFPPCLQIEPASMCNFRCVFCYQTDKDLTAPSAGHMGLMSLDTFKRVVDAAEGRCEAVTLASRGEPLINPQIDKMLEYAGKKFLAFKLNTNAWYLDERKTHSLLQAGLSTLVFSADAAKEPDYSRLRVNGNLERVLGNIRRFQEIRAKHYPDSRLITRVSGVKFADTCELDEMEKFWGNYVDQVAFVNYNPWENAYTQPANELTAPCSDLWRRMFVWWDGRVNPCDVDYKSTLSVGRIAAADLGMLWRSESYMSLRSRHLRTQRSQCEPCRRCSVV